MKSLAPRRIESRQNSRIKELRAGLARGVKSPHIAVEGLHLTAGSGEERAQAAYACLCATGTKRLLEHLAVGRCRSPDRDRRKSFRAPP